MEDLVGWSETYIAFARDVYSRHRPRKSIVEIVLVSIADGLCPKNDPAKTICATMFIIAVVQNIKIGDLSSTQSGLSLSSDAPGESMDVDEVIRLPDGTELGASPSLSKAEERTLVRESTAGFAGAYQLFNRQPDKLIKRRRRLGYISLSPRFVLVRKSP
jgi:hypothetical protein